MVINDNVKVIIGLVVGFFRYVYCLIWMWMNNLSWLVMKIKRNNVNVYKLKLDVLLFLIDFLIMLFVNLMSYFSIFCLFLGFIVKCCESKKINKKIIR